MSTVRTPVDVVVPALLSDLALRMRYRFTASDGSPWHVYFDTDHNCDYIGNAGDDDSIADGGASSTATDSENPPSARTST